ncbi:MAG: DUF58 domain-containing protein [Firmicutes bacterium]|nr:DUF58 domain-containing protein [Bacillota bacterium]
MILIYIGVTVSFFFAAGVNDSYRLMVISLTLALYLLLSHIILFVQRVKAEVPLKSICTKSESVFDVNVKLYIKSLFPQSIAKVYYVFDGKKGKETFKIKRGENVLKLSLTSNKCNIVDLNIKKIKIYDIFCIFSRSKTVKTNIGIALLPVADENFSLDMPFSSEKGGENTNTVFGEQTRDVKQLRSYERGDVLRHIHWNATASKDELQIKEYENSSAFKTDMAVRGERVKEREYIIRLYSALNYALKFGAVTLHYVLGGKVFQKNVTSLHEADEFILFVYKTKNFDKYEGDIFAP